MNISAATCTQNDSIRDSYLYLLMIVQKKKNQDTLFRVKQTGGQW